MSELIFFFKAASEGGKWRAMFIEHQMTIKGPLGREHAI